MSEEPLSPACVRIIKLAAASNAKTNPISWSDFVPGSKLGVGNSLPIDYQVDGRLLSPILPNVPLLALRHDRNGISALGIFRTTPVAVVFAMTSNSVYRIEPLLEPPSQRTTDGE